jgi:hypothetical protein
MHHFNKVIIWGFPLYSHTHSFVHYGWYRAFKHLGYDTYWFHDRDYPQDFDFSNALFISEGYADNNIPINSSSIYYIHICINPQKYLEKNARLIDLRHSVRFLQDFSYDYEMDIQSLEKLDDFIYYEKNACDLALREKYRNNISGYEALYIIWATDLLPEEIDHANIYKPKENKIYNIGSVWHSNRFEISEFEDECKQNNIEFVKKNPWREITSIEDNIKMIQLSYIAPDIRGCGPISDECILSRSNHLATGYIPCRIFKNISYGQLGATNSWAVNKLFKNMTIYTSDVRDLFHKAKKERENYSLIKEQMDFVKTNHTYINRANNLLSII